MPSRSPFGPFSGSRCCHTSGIWEKAGRVPRGLFAAAGKSGFLGIDVFDEYGGRVADFRFNAIVSEEVRRTGASAAGLGLTLHNDICIPYPRRTAGKP
jgi:long-chain-acyl-CoA dehydrogenase